MKDLYPALLISILLHAAAAGGMLWYDHSETRVAGAPTVSVSLIDAVEAHRPRSQQARPEAKPQPALKPLTPLSPPEPSTENLEKMADDVMDSVASLSAAVKAAESAEPVSQASFNADYLHNPKPQYPALSRRLGEEGRVLLHVQVSTSGEPLEVTVKESSGFKRLDQAAVDVVKHWQFVPAKQGNTALASWVDVPLQFSLEK